MTKSYYLYHPRKALGEGLYKEMISYTPDGDKVTLCSWSWDKPSKEWILIGQKLTVSIEEARLHWLGCTDPKKAPNDWEQFR